MQTITTVGLDIAKSVFQVHCVDANGDVVLRRQLKRRYVLTFFQKLPPCLVGIEACASSHHWSRQLQALGHTVRLMPPELERGQRQAWQHQQTRRSLSAQLVYDRRACRDPLCENPWHQASTLAYRLVGASAHQGRCHRARQQDRADGVGDDGQGRALQRTCRTRGVTKIASGYPA